MSPIKADLPAKLPEPFTQSVTDYCQQLDASTEINLENFPEVVKLSLAKVFACSEYIARRCIRQPAVLADMVSSGDLLADYQPEDYTKRLTTALTNIDSQDALHRVLREFRQWQWIRIVWRDIAGWRNWNKPRRS